MERVKWILLCEETIDSFSHAVLCTLNEKSSLYLLLAEKKNRDV